MGPQSGTEDRQTGGVLQLLRPKRGANAGPACLNRKSNPRQACHEQVVVEFLQDTAALFRQSIGRQALAAQQSVRAQSQHDVPGELTGHGLSSA